MRLKSLVVAMAAVASLAPVMAQAQAEENPWMLRVRAVYVDWQNGQANGSSTAAGVQTNNINALKKQIRELNQTIDDLRYQLEECNIKLGNETNKTCPAPPDLTSSILEKAINFYKPQLDNHIKENQKKQSDILDKQVQY